MNYVIELQEVQVDEFGSETIDIWTEWESFNKISEAKKLAKGIAKDIRNKESSYINYINDKNNSIGIVIAKYYGYGKNENNPFEVIAGKSKYIPGSIVDVIDIDLISPKDWNVDKKE